MNEKCWIDNIILMMSNIQKKFANIIRYLIKLIDTNIASVHYSYTPISNGNMIASYKIWVFYKFVSLKPFSLFKKYQKYNEISQIWYLYLCQ